MLLVQTSVDWVNTVIQDMDTFLLDHAACERKASSMAMSMICHYPDRAQLVAAMTDLALEEMQHFRQVMRLILKRGLVLPPDTKDMYVIGLRDTMRKGREEFFLDRMLIASIIEARGAERFQMIADHVQEDSLKTFYAAIARSEEKHYELFLALAGVYFKEIDIKERLATLLEVEASIVASLPSRVALH